MANLLPAKWKYLFKAVDMDEADRERFLAAYVDRAQRLIPNECVEEWSADQDKARVSIECEDGVRLTARFELIASFDGETVLWADANPSLQAPLTQSAKAYRAGLKAGGVGISVSDKFEGNARDLSAMVAAAAEQGNAQRAFVAPSGRTQIGMLLFDTEGGPAPEPPATEKEGPTFLSRLFSKKEQPAPGPTLFDQINAMIADQVARVQPEERKLVEIEALLSIAFDAYARGEFVYALDLAHQAEALCGDWPADAEPAGWLYLVKGWSHYWLGEHPQALKAFSVAGHAVEIPLYASVLLGQARCKNNQRDQLADFTACYVKNPEWFAANAQPHEMSLIEQAINAVEQEKRKEPTDPKEWLLQAMNHLCDHEKQVWALWNAAQEQREDSHILSDADHRAEATIHALYQPILLRYFAPKRSPHMSSYSSEPDLDPDRLTSMELIREDADSAEILVKTKTSFDMENTHRYALVRTATPFSEDAHWRIDKLWSVWDDEEVLLN